MGGFAAFVPEISIGHPQLYCLLVSLKTRRESSSLVWKGHPSSGHACRTFLPHFSQSTKLMASSGMSTGQFITSSRSRQKIHPVAVS